MRINIFDPVDFNAKSGLLLILRIQLLRHKGGLCMHSHIIGAIDDVNGSRVRPSVRTSRRLRMRDIHVIYADSNSADCWFYTRTRSRSPPDVLHFTSIIGASLSEPHRGIYSCCAVCIMVDIRPSPYRIFLRASFSPSPLDGTHL